MITIEFEGLDQFVVGHYSKEHSANLAQLFEIDENELCFYAPNSMIFHAGVEQTSWNGLVIVHAPRKYGLFEKKIADYLLKTVIDFSVNLEVRFDYFEESHVYSYLNPSYPRYIAADQLKKDEYDGSMYETGEDPEFDKQDAECPESKELDINDENQIYLGNAFENFEEELEKRQKAFEKGEQDAKDELKK